MIKTFVTFYFKTYNKVVKELIIVKKSIKNSNKTLRYN